MNLRRVEQFSALGQEDRLKIFRLLVRAGPQGNCVDNIKRRVKVPGSTLSHHLDALTRSRLLSARRAGRFIFYAVNWSETADLIRFLTEDCCAEMYIGHSALADSGRPQVRDSREAACCTEVRPGGRRIRTRTAVKGAQIVKETGEWKTRS